jgi:enoyl-CoA hydratase/carnithine racemase
MRYKYFLFKQENSVGMITINRPDLTNALNDDSLVEFRQIINGVGNLKGVRSLIITGIGQKAFSAGSDIDEMLDKEPSFFRIHSLLGHQVMEAIERLRQPVVAVINGHAIGGGLDLALACDFRIAADDIKVGLPEVNLNFPGGWGSAWRLPRLIGLAKTKELVLLGRIIDAKAAFQIGLLTKVVPRDQLLDEAKSLAKELAEKNPVAMELAKFLTNHSLEMPGVPFTYLESLSNAYSSTFDDFHEKMRMFIKKAKGPKKTNSKLEKKGVIR